MISTHSDDELVIYHVRKEFSVSVLCNSQSESWNCTVFSDIFRTEEVTLYANYIKNNMCVCIVIATMRDLKKKDRLLETVGDAYGKTLSLLMLDVCSDVSVSACINNIKDRHIDILSKDTHTHTI